MSSSYGTANRGRASYASNGQRLCCVCHKNKVTKPAKKCASCKTNTKSARGGSGERQAKHASAGRAGRSTYTGGSIAVSTSFYEDLRQAREAQARAAGLPANKDDMYQWLSAWLEMPGHSVELLRKITAPTARDWLKSRPGANYADMARHILACERELTARAFAGGAA